MRQFTISDTATFLTVRVIKTERKPVTCPIKTH